MINRILLVVVLVVLLYNRDKPPKKQIFEFYAHENIYYIDKEYGVYKVYTERYQDSYICPTMKSALIRIETMQTEYFEETIYNF